MLITSQLRTALIFNKKIKATNYQIDTYKKKIFIYGISLTTEERKEVINEAKEILDAEDVIASIVLVEDLRIQKINFFYNQLHQQSRQQLKLNL